MAQSVYDLEILTKNEIRLLAWTGFLCQCLPSLCENRLKLTTKKKRMVSQPIHIFSVGLSFSECKKTPFFFSRDGRFISQNHVVEDVFKGFFDNTDVFTSLSGRRFQILSRGNFNIKPTEWHHLWLTELTDA